MTIYSLFLRVFSVALRFIASDRLTEIILKRKYNLDKIGKLENIFLQSLNNKVKSKKKEETSASYFFVHVEFGSSFLGLDPSQSALGNIPDKTGRELELV